MQQLFLMQFTKGLPGLVGHWGHLQSNNSLQATSFKLQASSFKPQARSCLKAISTQQLFLMLFTKGLPGLMGHWGHLQSYNSLQATSYKPQARSCLKATSTQQLFLMLFTKGLPGLVGHWGHLQSNNSSLACLTGRQTANIL
jgi:hypothetical protein